MNLRDLIGRVSVMADISGRRRLARDTSVRAAALLRGPIDRARATISGMGEIEEAVRREAEGWCDPSDIAAGQGGPFDACDLRFWLMFAERAGVPFVPAREILSLSEDEISSLSPAITLPDHVSKGLARGLARLRQDGAGESLPSDQGGDLSVAPDREGHGRRGTEELFERLFEAMEDVPSDWMVRTNLSGSSMLKALAGSGVLGSGKEGAEVTEGVQVGAGWVRAGNRARIDATDTRFIKMFAQGHKDRLHYLARPWMAAGRFGEGDDPHRHGTPFAGKGRWPMEWRCFVEGGRVTGVAAYYGWVGAVTPENAAKALEAVEMAEKVVAAAEAAGTCPRWMDIELLRSASPEALERPELRAVLDRFPRDQIACTLDFIETEDGMMFLEGGPPYTPIGGGHPCAFAGFEMSREGGGRPEGVALKLIDGVLLGDPRTWSGKENDGSILTMDEARALALQYRGADLPSP